MVDGYMAHAWELSAYFQASFNSMWQFMEGTTAVSDLLCACKHSCVLVQKLESQQRDQAVMMTSIADRLERLERQLQVCKGYISGSADEDLLAQLACASMADLPSA